MKDHLTLFKEIGKLKRTDREGWKRLGVEDVESVADHSFRCAFIAMLVGEKLNVDISRLVKMLLVHDIPEVKIGDLTPSDGIDERKKRVMERNGLESLLEGTSSPIKDELIELWDEFENGESKEAALARDIDKLERIIQAREYQERYTEKDFSEFLIPEEIETEEVKTLIDDLKIEL